MQFSPHQPASQSVITNVGGQFVVEEIRPTPAEGEPMQTLREALMGIQVIATGSGEATVFTAAGPRFRVFNPTD